MEMRDRLETISEEYLDVSKRLKEIEFDIKDPSPLFTRTKFEFDHAVEKYVDTIHKVDHMEQIMKVLIDTLSGKL